MGGSSYLSSSWSLSVSASSASSSVATGSQIGHSPAGSRRTRSSKTRAQIGSCGSGWMKPESAITSPSAENTCGPNLLRSTCQNAGFLEASHKPARIAASQRDGLLRKWHEDRIRVSDRRSPIENRPAAGWTLTRVVSPTSPAGVRTYFREQIEAADASPNRSSRSFALYRHLRSNGALEAHRPADLVPGSIGDLDGLRAQGNHVHTKADSPPTKLRIGLRGRRTRPGYAPRPMRQRPG